jgi:hypothetical protein
MLSFLKFRCTWVYMFDLSNLIHVRMSLFGGATGCTGQSIRS